MGVKSFPEESDWAPPPDVVKLIARHAAQMLMRSQDAPEDDASQGSLDIFQEQPDGASSSNYKGTQQMQSKTPSKQTLNGSSSTSLARSWKAVKDAQMFTSLSQSTVVTASPEPDEMTMAAAVAAADETDASQRRSTSMPNQRYTIRKVHTSFVDHHWKKYHQEPWNGSLRVPQDLYSPATPDTCACQTPFDDGAFFCKRCGDRRPIEKPPAMPTDVPKVINVINQDQAIIDRQYAWSGLYAQRLYRMQLQAFEQNEAYQSEEFFTPRTNPNSKRIAGSKDMVPLMERVGDILENKHRKLEQQRKDKEEAFHADVQEGPVIHPRSARLRRSLHHLYRWEVKRTRSVESRMEKQRLREADECTFKPSVSRGSNRIAHDYVEVQVHDRLIQDASRRFQEAEDLQNTLKLTPFTPEFPSFRSKAATPSTTAPSSPASPMRGQKFESWRGRSAFPQMKPLQTWQQKKQQKENSMNHLPRASAVIFRAPSVDSGEAARLKRQKKHQMEGRAQSSSPHRGSSGKAGQSPKKASASGNSINAWERLKPGMGVLDDNEEPTNFTGGANKIQYKPDHYLALKIAHGSFDFWNDT
mmetsp:Transcript_14647/g.25951  ORF Transcript_14647/g.25951 Transcript_14647/m.25951 type:complete len:585 (+) Transcript_14647:143-1897(+)